MKEKEIQFDHQLNSKNFPVLGYSSNVNELKIVGFTLERRKYKIFDRVCYSTVSRTALYIITKTKCPKDPDDQIFISLEWVPKDQLKAKGFYKKD